MIDATPLLLSSAGVKSVLYHWIKALTEQSEPETIHLYPPMGRVSELHHEHSVASRWATLRGLAMVVANQRLGANFPQWCAAGMDVFHCTNQVRTPPSSARLTATIHDLTCWKMPELHTQANVAADRRYAEHVLTKADGLIAVSENSRRDAIEVLGLEPERITTIHNGVSEPYFGNCAPLQGAKPYVLHTGTIEPRKNIDRLLDAWESLPQRVRNDYDLLLAGPAGWGSTSTIQRLKAGPPGVVWLGYVPEQQMPALTRGATLIAYPSLYEGFGLPVAQAMACGVACVTSNVSSLPEVAGPGARLVNPQSMEELREALISLLESPDERARLGAAGKAYAESHYRWRLAAEKSLEFFRRTMEA